ncbi:MAG: acyl--CoA ligase, partial [Ruminococcus sp.]|nr:acyl--CoA ligase [Ruminococcus sp.]
MHKMYTYQDFKIQMKDAWQKCADKTAVVRLEEDGERTALRYAELLDIAEQTAQLLSEGGLGRADRAAVITPYSAQAVVLNLALAYAGYTAVLIDAALPPDERNRLLEYADVSAVFTIEEIYRTLDKGLLEGVPAFMIRKDFVFARFPDSVHTVTKITAAPRSEDVIAILFSSGTTGTMKG